MSQVPSFAKSVLDFVDDAREVYRPDAVEALGVPAPDVQRLTKQWGNYKGVIGLELIEWLADVSNVDPYGPSYVGWQRIMRSLKASIRRKVGLPPVAGEGDE